MIRLSLPRQVLCFVALVSLSSGHFLLNYPPTIGFDDDLESTAPCGSFSPDFSTDNVTNFGVAGSAIALTSIHPQATWLFRATLDITASGNWTILSPPVVQTGLGVFCEPSVSVPASWAGSKGVIGIVQDAPDGILYQCAAVNFVAGTLTPPSDCTNVTGLSASYTADPALSTLPATGTASVASSTGSATGSTNSPAASSTAKPSAANTIHFSGSQFGLFVWVAMIGSATFVAFLL